MAKNSISACLLWYISFITGTNASARLQNITDGSYGSSEGVFQLHFVIFGHVLALSVDVPFAFDRLPPQHCSPGEQAGCSWHTNCSIPGAKAVRYGVCFPSVQPRQWEAEGQAGHGALGHIPGVPSSLPTREMLMGVKPSTKILSHPPKWQRRG